MVSHCGKQLLVSYPIRDDNGSTARYQCTKTSNHVVTSNRTSQGDDVLGWPNYFGHEFFIVSWVIHEERIKS